MPYKDVEKKRKYAREWMAKRRASYFDDKCCVDCGSTENLELDHIDPEEKESHNVWSWSEKRRQNEIEKCEVRCRSCHRTRHGAMKIKPIVHGTRYGYNNRGCRCEKCKKADSIYRQKWRAKRLRV